MSRSTPSSLRRCLRGLAATSLVVMGALFVVASIFRAEPSRHEPRRDRSASAPLETTPPETVAVLPARVGAVSAARTTQTELQPLESVVFERSPVTVRAVTTRQGCVAPLVRSRIANDRGFSLRC